MLNGNRLRDRLDRIEKQLFQANILLLVLIAICLLGFTGKLIFAFEILFWLGLIVGFVFLVSATINNITAEKAEKRMEQKFHDLIEKAKAEQQKS